MYWFFMGKTHTKTKSPKKVFLVTNISMIQRVIGVSNMAIFICIINPGFIGWFSLYSCLSLL